MTRSKRSRESMILPTLPSIRVMPGETGRRTVTGRTLQQSQALFAGRNR